MIALLIAAQLAGAGLSGVVYLDRNGNGVRDAGEAGLAGVAVSDQADVVVTDAGGAFRITGARGTGVVFVSVPSGYRSVGPFWRPASGPLSFALAAVRDNDGFTFVHASDTHIQASSRQRTVRLRGLVDSLRPDFVMITGDLVRDALRVGEAEAAGYYDLFQAEAALFSVPLWTVPGNHEIFGIERNQSGVPAGHPLYGRAMYRHYRGPDYYSFTAGGVHFVGLNTVDHDDMWYYGHVDSLQLAWLARDLAVIPPDMPVVTFNHIPFFTAFETVAGYSDRPPAPTTITVRGRTVFRHNVSNAAEVIAAVAPHPYPLALGGHMHVREQLRYQGVATRFYQAAAVVGPSRGAGMAFPSGITVYRVRRGVIDDGTFVPLGETPTP